MDAMVWHIGDVLRKKREAHGWTRNQLAQRAHVKPNTLGYLERDGARYEPETLRKVVKALGTTEAEVFALVPVTPAVTPPIQTEDPADVRAWSTYRILPETGKHSVRTVIYSLAAAHSIAPAGGNEIFDAGATPADLKRVK